MWWLEGKCKIMLWKSHRAFIQLEQERIIYSDPLPSNSRSFSCTLLYNSTVMAQLLNLKKIEVSYVIWKNSILAPKPGVRGPQGHEVQRHSPVLHHLYPDNRWIHANRLCSSPSPNKTLICRVLGRLNQAGRGDWIKKGMTFRV